MSAKHSVFVLDINGKPLMPTTPSKVSSVKKNLKFVSSNYIIKEVVAIPLAPKGTGFLATKL